jgi:hypothetical protein
MSDGRELTEGGDPVCWLDRVCDDCGAFREDPAAGACARCGTAFPEGNGGAGRSDGSGGGSSAAGSQCAPPTAAGAPGPKRG